MPSPTEQNDAGGLAIMAGAGDLPRLLAEKCRHEGRNYLVVQFPGVPLDWTEGHPVEAVKFEKFGHIFKTLRAHGCTRVAFAGAMARPKLNPTRFDRKFVSVAPTLLSALKGGDDATLRAIGKIMEDEGFEVVAPHSELGSLIVEAGVLTKARPSIEDKSDAARAQAIVDALGSVDVGQGAVVAQGICLAVESIQGTDRMLQFVADTADGFRPDPKGGKGVLYKGVKPDQDKRMDVPTIGPNTVDMVAKAGLGGIVMEAGEIEVVDLPQTIARADALGLFLWARPKQAGAA
jgi:DUF1009 family protein